MKIAAMAAVAVVPAAFSLGASALEGTAFSTDDPGLIRSPVPPMRITDNVTLPVESHSWKTNLYFDPQDWSDQDYPELISLIADPVTIHIHKGGGGPTLAG